jgi:hypothetical protein
MQSETKTTEIIKENKPQTFNEITNVAQQGAPLLATQENKLRKKLIKTGLQNYIKTLSKKF